MLMTLIFLLVNGTDVSIAEVKRFESAVACTAAADKYQQELAKIGKPGSFECQISEAPKTTTK